MTERLASALVLDESSANEAYACRLHKAHHRGRTLPGTQAAG